MPSRYLAAICFLVALNAYAQSLTPAELAGALQQKAYDPTLQSNIAIPTAQVAVEGTNDQSTVTTRIGVLVRNVVLETRLSAPLGSTGNQTNGASVDLGLTWGLWNPVADPARQREACIAALIGGGTAKDQSEAAALLRKINDNGAIAYPCTRLSLQGKYRDQFDNAVSWGTPLLLTARAKFTSGTFQSTGAIATIIPTGDLLQVSFQYQQGTQRQRIVQFESRIFPTLPIGLNPKLAYDLESRTATFDLPLYLFHAKEGGLNAGIIAGWRSDTKAFKISMFLGEVFTLLSR